MDKYQGITRPETRFTAAEEVKTVKKTRGGYLKGLLARVICAVVLLAAAFGLKFAPFSFSEPATAAVKTAVLFDLNPAAESEYFFDQLKKLLNENGG